MAKKLKGDMGIKAGASISISRAPRADVVRETSKREGVAGYKSLG